MKTKFVKFLNWVLNRYDIQVFELKTGSGLYVVPNGVKYVKITTQGGGGGGKNAGL